MLTDSQMMLLEQIMYIHDEVYSNGNAKIDKDAKTIQELLCTIDTDALKANPNMDSSYIQYAEWGATIEAIKNDPDLMELKIRESLHNKSGQKIATCFEDKSGHAIVAMEELFEYLDQKYEEEFEYAGYIAESPLDTEQLMVQVVGGTSLDIVSVYRENGVITDDYANLLVKEPYEAAINEFFEQYEGGIESKTFSAINFVNGDVNTKNLLSIINASSGIYIPESKFNIKELDVIAHKFGKWYVEQADGMRTVKTIIILEDQEYKELNKFNAFEHDKKEIARIRIYINQEGELDIN